MSKEKTNNPIDHSRDHSSSVSPLQGQPALAFADGVTGSLPHGGNVGGASIGGGAPPVGRVVQVDVADALQLSRPSPIKLGIIFAALLAAMAAMGFIWFGTQPVTDGGFVLGLIVVCLGAHLYGIHKGQSLVAAVALLVMMLATWHHAFFEMWHRWFPAWERMKNAPITTRLSAGDSYYSHGPLVPIASIIICYLIYQRVGLPTGVTRSSRRWGGAIFCFSLFMQLVAARGDVNFVSGFALVGLIGSLVLIWGGWPLVRAYWLPIVFLLFMVPLPMDTIAKINYQLKTVASDAAVWITNHVFGVVAVLNGATVHLVPDADGNAKTLVVENVCGGLRSMISLICFGTLFALVCRVKGYWRWLMLALSVPLAIGCNIMRITSMNLVAHYFSVEAAGEESWFHTFSGIMVFALALAAMFGIEQIIIWASKRWKKDWVDQRLLGYLDELPPSRADGVRPYHPAVMSSLVLVAALTTLWVFEAPGFNRGDVAKQAVPGIMQIDGESFKGTDGEMSLLERNILQTDDYLKRRYNNGKRRDESRDVDLTIVFSANNRKGTHPPDVCLEGSGARIVHKQLHDVTFTAIHDGKPLEETIEVRELISEQHGFQTLHLYYYKCGDSYTPNYLTQQLIIFLNGLMSRNSAGALIRVDVQIGRADSTRLAEARRFALVALQAFAPEIDRGLP